MYDLYDCRPILRMPSKVKFKYCICGENPNGMTLVFDCDNHHILVYYVHKSHLKCDINGNILKKNVVLRQIPFDKSKGELRSMTLNGNCSQLMTIDSNSNIFIIPIQRLIECQNDCLLKEDALLINSCSLSNPTAIVWWNSLDDYNQIAIVGNDFGEISFINIKTKREIGGTYVQNSVTKLEIIDDKSAVSLLIRCKNGSQFRLILEETRSKCAVKSRPESRLPTHEHYYFNCFITPTEEREPIGPNNCWNFKPTLIDLLNDNNFQEKDEIIAMTVVYQKPLYLCLSEVLSENKESVKMIVRLISNKEFDYKLSSFFAKYSFPKQCSSAISGVILTDRLFFIQMSNSCSLISKEFSDSRKLAKLNPIIQKFDFGSEEVINTFILTRSTANQVSNEDYLDSFLVMTDRCLYLCHQKESCHQLFHSMVSLNPSSNSSDSSLLVRAQRFTSMLGLNINSLLERSAVSCLEKQEFSSAVRFYQLAKTAQIRRITDFLFFAYFDETIAYIEVLFSTKCHEIEESDRMHFANICVKCFVQQLLQKSIIDEQQVIEKAFKTFLRNCLYYNESLVLQLLVEQGLFELALYCAQVRAQFGLLLHYLLEYSSFRSKSLKDFTYETLLETEYKDLLLKTTESESYLNCLTSHQITYSLILRKDLISKYLRFIIKLLPNLDICYLQKLATILDPRRPETQLLLNRVFSHLKETYLSAEDIEQQIIQRKDILNLFILITLMILRQNGSVTAFDQKFISIDSLIKNIEKTNRKQLLIETVGLSAGVSHSAYIKNGCLYMWGKSQFGCCGLQNNQNYISKQISNPTRLDFFKEVLSISVKSVSCGSHHSLVLTDFGVYAFGSSRFGQLGVGKEIVLSRNPLIITELVNKDIVKIECGQYHSLAISSSGVLYTWGWNLFGQLGIGSIDDAHTPQVVQYFIQMNIIQAFAGFGHTIALDSSGFVYAFGSGSYGQLGVGAVVKQTIPVKVSLLDEPIRQISTKYFHSLALSRENSTLYLWGTNPQSIRLQANYARKSRHNHQEQSEEKIVPNLEHLKPIKLDISEISSRITKISTGSLHSLLLTADGGIYSFGRGIDGQLGQGKVKEQKYPTKIVSLDDINVLDIAAGSDFSLAVDISGNIWGFGHNSDGQIGPMKTSISENKSPNEEKNKKISIKTNRRLITFMTKCLECLPIRIPFVEDIETYCDSLNYSLDINAMKTSTRFSLIDDNMNVLSNETSITFDRKVLALLLAFYRQELDLFSIQSRFKSFKCHQMTAFVYEIQNDFSNAFDFQLEALQLSVPKDCNQFNEFYTKIFYHFMNKCLENIDKSADILHIFIKFWIKNEFDFNCFETFLENCFKNEFQDSMFGISFFNYLKNNQNICNKFNTSFLLEMVDFTIKNISKRPQKLFSYQTEIERITSDIEEVSFPAEKLWQNILTYFRCDKRLDSQTSLQIEATEEEIVVFNCSHFFALNDLKQTIVPQFQNDLKQLKTIETKEIQTVLDMYRDSNKEVWDCVCPQCFLIDIKSKISIYD